MTRGEHLAEKNRGARPQQGEGQPVLHQAVNEAPARDVPPAVRQVFRAPGQPPDGDDPPRTGGSRFGHDFSQVRVRALAPRQIQTKLAVNRPGDEYEREADRIAGQVMRMPEVGLQRQANQDAGKHVLQTKPLGPAPAGGDWGAEPEIPAIVHQVLRSPGRPLDPATRTFMERRFQHDFDQVRVHTDAQAARSARTINAQAFAVGQQIVFGAGRYAPGTTAGKHLLAHELTHTIQQQLSGQLSLNRQEGGEATLTANDRAIHSTFPDVRIERRKGGGFARLTVRGIEWARVTWDPERGDAVEFELARKEIEVGGITEGVAFGLRVKARFPVTVQIDRGVEDLRGDLPTLFSYDMQAKGTMQLGDEQLKGPARAQYYHVPTHRGEYLRLGQAPNPDALDPFGPLPARDRKRERQKKRERVERLVAGHPSFDTWQEMESYIREHRGESFLGIKTPDGRFVARRITEEDLQALADTERRGTTEIEETPFSGRQPPLFTITGVYIKGRTLSIDKLDTLREQYYASAWDAYLGHGATRGSEAEIYHMGDRSFGRRVLNHSEALDRWRELDAYDAQSIENVQTMPGHRFAELVVQTPHGWVHIDWKYFVGRDAFYRHAGRIDELASSQFGADLLVGNRLANPLYALLQFYGERQDVAADIRHFLEIELYREQEDPRFRALLGRREPLAAALAASVYEDARQRARVLVLTTLDKSLEQLRPLVEDRGQMREFVRQMPAMSAEQRGEMVQMLGVPENYRSDTVVVLGDPQRAANVVYGQTEKVSRTYSEPIVVDTPNQGMRTYTHTYTKTTKVSLDLLHKWAKAQLEGLQEFRDKTDKLEIDPLKTGGDFGNQVRQRVYAEMGFTELHAEDFPHDNATTEFMPGPLARTTMQLPTLAEQLFANHAARNEDVEFIRLIGKITLMVVATVALAIASGGLGAGVAGFFGLSGTFLGAAVEVGVAALSFTAISTLAQALITGEMPSGWEFAGNLFLNAATFGVFRALQPVFVAASEALVASRGVGTAIRSTVGARAGTVAAHTGMEFASFLAFGIGSFVIQHDRLPQSGREWFIVGYESALTAVLMRAGSTLAQPWLETMASRVRDLRLGDLKPAFDQLRGDSLRFERDFQAALAARPQRIGTEGVDLATRGQELLVRKSNLARQLEQRARTRGDAQVVREIGEQIEAIKAILQGLERLGGFGELKVQPVGEGGTVYTYRPNERALQLLRTLYGEGNVTVDAQGRVRVSVPGAQGIELTYLPQAMRGEAETIASQQLSLTERMQRLSERADLFDVDPAELVTVRGTRPEGGGRRTGGIRPGARRTVESIREAEQLVGAAETAVEAEIARIAGKAYKQFRRTPARAEALAQARQGELAGLTDTQVGEAIHLFVYRSQLGSRGRVESVRTIYRLGMRQLRGVLFAYQEGVNLPRLRGRVRSFTEEQRNFVLDTYAQMMEARIDGATRVLNEMLQSDNKFEGGTYAMEFARNQIGLDRIAKMEKSELNPNRIVDIILTDGTRVELKAWREWQHGKLEWQFEKDVFEVCGRNFATPEAIQRLQYVFRPPIPRQTAQIRSLLRTRLTNMLERANVSRAVRQEMLSQFDLHTNLVQEGVITRSGGRAAEPVDIAEPPVPPPGQREDEKENAPPNVPIQRKKRIGAALPQAVPPLVHQVVQARGRPLDAGTRASMESRFEHDFSRVRVHAGARAAESARRVGAQAYTAGQNVVLGAGQYPPRTQQEWGLIAHELAHVVQQSAGPQAAQAEPAVARGNGRAEAEAEGIGRAVARGAAFAPPNAAPEGGLQRRGFFAGLAGLFAGDEFPQEELQAYLKFLDGGKIEDFSDSDNKARAVVNAWRTGASPYDLTPRRKVLLIQEMQSGDTGDDDEQAILEILERSDNSALSAIIGASGVTPESLESDIDGEEADRLHDFYERRFKGGAEAVLNGQLEPVGEPLALGASPPPPSLYEQKVQEAQQRLAGVRFGNTGGLQIGNMCLPESRQTSSGYKIEYWYDREFWEPAIDRFPKPGTDEMLASCKLTLQSGKSPAAAIDALFDHQDRWQVDCAHFVQIAHLYALRHTLGTTRFDAKYKGDFKLELRRRESPGVVTEVLYKRDRSDAAFRRSTDGRNEERGEHQLLAEAPVGSRVRWTNTDEKAIGKAWENENTIKMGQDRYAGHPLSKVEFPWVQGPEYILSRREVEEHLAEATNSDADAAYIKAHIFISEIEIFQQPGQGGNGTQ